MYLYVVILFSILFTRQEQY